MGLITEKKQANERNVKTVERMMEAYTDNGTVVSTQLELAAKLNLSSKNTISSWKFSEKLIPTKYLAAVAEETGVSLYFLRYGLDNKERYKNEREMIPYHSNSVADIDETSKMLFTKLEIMIIHKMRGLHGDKKNEVMAEILQILNENNTNNDV